jgi:hypothetical protein
LALPGCVTLPALHPEVVVFLHVFMRQPPFFKGYFATNTVFDKVVTRILENFSPDA